MPRSFDSVFYGAAGTDTDTGPSDDEFNRVSFLSHFDGANNGVNNAFDDGSSNNHTISNAGSPTQGSFGPFARPDGGWGVDFSINTMLTIPTSADLNLGTGDFTLECFIFVQSTEDNGGIMSKRGAGSFDSSYRLSYRTGTKKVSFAMSGSPEPEVSSPVVEKGIWTHIAVVRDSGTLSIYAAGVQGGTVSSNTSDMGGNQPFTIGSQYIDGSSVEFNFVGIISNARFVKGTAVYSGSSFTPPTGKLTAITNTKLLTCQSNRFVDNSASAHALTLTGAPAVTAFGPFLTSAVYNAAVNGASSSPLDVSTYLSIADGSWKTLGTGDFTWEFWFYGKTESPYMIGDGTAGTNVSATFTLGVSGKRLLLYYSIQGGEAYPLQSPNSAPFYNLNEWHHVAYVRSGNDHKIYANGVLRATATRSGTMVDSTGVQHIGDFGSGFSGGSPTIFSDVRLVKGTAVYSGSTYTVPTAPLTAISNTELLLNFKDAQAIDSAAQNNMTLVADSKISTAQKKIGTSSLYVDGSGDYVTFPYTPFGTGDFTVECWVRCLGSTYDKGIWDNHTASGSSDGLTLTRIAAAQFRLFGTGELIRSGNFTITNTWVNVTVVRSSGTLNLFVNGVSQGTTSFTTNLNSAADFVIGGGRYSGDPTTGAINAYVDEFRISHMARYSSNFTPDTEPFADKGK